jgi:hypothetical protein
MIEPALSLCALRFEPGAPPTSPITDPASHIRAAVTFARTIGLRRLVLDGMIPGLRARELDRSARRDLAALARRDGLVWSGIDLWIPPTHYRDTQTADRAVNAVIDACALAADIASLSEGASSGGAGGVGVAGGLGIGGGGRTREVVINLELPDGLPSVRQTLADAAERAGVRLADYGPAPQSLGVLGPGIDPAAILMRAGDLQAELARLASARSCVSARLCDGGPLGRVPVNAAGGRLDVPIYRAMLEVMTDVRTIIIDARAVPDPLAAARAAAAAWLM